MLNLRAFTQKIFEAWIGILSMLSVRERLPGWILFAVIPDRKIMWVLVFVN